MTAKKEAPRCDSSVGAMRRTDAVEKHPVPIVTHPAKRRKRKGRRASFLDAFGVELPSGRDWLTFLGLLGIIAAMLLAAGQIANAMGVPL